MLILCLRPMACHISQQSSAQVRWVFWKMEAQSPPPPPDELVSGRCT